VTGVDALGAEVPANIDLVGTGIESLDEFQALLAIAGARDGAQFYRVRFRYVGHDEGPQPRDAQVTVDDVAAIDKALAVRDRNSKVGPWTVATLTAIRDNPGLSSAHLARDLGKERMKFKQDVRKLKSLGLTISLEVGYKLSVRGASYLAALPDSRSGAARQ
jgi:biotin operon repressor